MGAILTSQANKIDINVKQDGVYLYIQRELGAPEVTRAEVLSLIESYGVEDVDLAALTAALKSNKELQEIKISSNTNITQVSESAAIDVSKDRMSAFITFAISANNSGFDSNKYLSKYSFEIKPDRNIN